MYHLGAWFVSGICVWIPCIKETMMLLQLMMMMMIIIIIIIIIMRFCNVTQQINYEGWNFNSGNYLFTTGTK